MTDLISVIVLVYRVEEYIKKCMESVLNQTYTNLEIILVNDGSDDSCPKMCDEFVMMDERVRVIHKSNEGAHKARQAGILAANGKYVMFVDGDDWIEPGMIEELQALINIHKVDVVQCGIIDSWENDEKYRLPYFKEGCYKNEKFAEFIGDKLIYNGNFFQHGVFTYMWSKLFDREKILKYQLQDVADNNLLEDAMTIYPFIANTKSIYITHKCYYHYRVRVNSSKRLIRYDLPQVMMKSYNAMLKNTIDVPQEFKIREQLLYFTMYMLISRAVFVFDDVNDSEYLKPFGNIKKSSKIALYGAGVVGISLENYIKELDGSNLVYWADRNFKDLEGQLNVKEPKGLLNVDFDYLIISILSKEPMESAKKDLISLGIPKEKIKWVDEEYLKNPVKLLNYAKFNNETIFNMEN